MLRYIDDTFIIYSAMQNAHHQQNVALWKLNRMLRDMDYAAPMANHVTDNHASDFSCS